MCSGYFILSYRLKLRTFLVLLLLVPFAAIQSQAQSEHPSSNSKIQATPAPQPLFRDPVHDGAADPSLIWDRARKLWVMFYTNRRADLPDKTVAWVHGTHIGMAESKDGGIHWKYAGEAVIPYGGKDYTYWAPELVDAQGSYHMFLSIVPGIYTDWQAERWIIHLTSPDLKHWTFKSKLALESDRVIDPCVFKLPNGSWRIWYKDERDHSRIHFADSPDLEKWTPAGTAVMNRGEGPLVFQWHGSYWMVQDAWEGLGVHKSSDLTHWTRQPENLLSTPGTAPTDRAKGAHPDVILDGSGRAWLFYFTQQTGADDKPEDPNWKHRSVIHVTELHEVDGNLTADRNAPAYINLLPPPRNKKSDVEPAF